MLDPSFPGLCAGTLFHGYKCGGDHGFRCGESEHVRFGKRRDDPAKSIYWRLKELGDFPVLYGIYGAVSSFVSFQSPAIGL